MCDPLTIAAISAVAGGTYLQHKAQNERDNDMKHLQSAETARQDGFYANSKKYLDENQGAYDKGKVDAGMTAAAAGREAQYAAVDRNAPKANEPLQGSQVNSNSVVADTFARALAGAKADAQQQGAARAKLASFGDFFGKTAMDNNRRSGYIGMNGSFSQGSADVLPYELQHAATKTRRSATFGNLLTTLGSALASAGAGAGVNGLFAGAGDVGAGTIASTAGDATGNLFGRFVGVPTGLT